MAGRQGGHQQPQPSFDPWAALSEQHGWNNSNANDAVNAQWPSNQSQQHLQQQSRQFNQQQPHQQQQQQAMYNSAAQSGSQLLQGAVDPTILAAQQAQIQAYAAQQFLQQQQQQQRQQQGHQGHQRAQSSQSSHSQQTQQPTPTSAHFPSFPSGTFANNAQGWSSQYQQPSVLTPTFEHQQMFMQQQQAAARLQQQQQQQKSQPQQAPMAAPQQFAGLAQNGQAFNVATTENSFADDGDDDDESRRKGGPQKGGTSDFVKKLFTMLDDVVYSSIVSWSATGDSFVVRNMNDFTKHVLPRHFRHSNFASFVRQLNKYDFHKVKNPEEQGNSPADQVWEFKHPDFVRGREDLLENVRRKLPTGKKKSDERDSSPVLNAAEAADRGAEEYSQLKEQIATLTATQDQMSSHISKLTKQYQGVIGEMLTFQRNMVQQDQLMQNLIQYLMNLENDRKIEAANSSKGSVGAISDGPFMTAQETSRLVGSYEQMADAAFEQMSQISHRAASQAQGAESPPGGTKKIGLTAGSQRRPSASGGVSLSPKSMATVLSPLTPATELPAIGPPATDAGKAGASANSMLQGNDTSMFLHPPHLDDSDSKTLFNTASNMVENPSLAAFENAGLRVFTVGTLQPREGSGAAATLDTEGGSSSSTLNAAFANNDSKGATVPKGHYGITVPQLESLPKQMPKVDKRATSGRGTPGAASSPDDDSRGGTPSEGASNLLRVRRSTYVPGWAVPPRVLLVDDDAVCRKLSQKFLQVSGCAIDVAVDGVNAVNKMNLEQYDLVLMDIVMPNLDGVSATSLIREFDPRTPIISMTSNSGPQELLNYMSSGMNDILPKPFTKEGLVNMLEKHLIHLKTVEKMDQIPKQLGLPPVSKDVLQGVLSATAASAAALDITQPAISSPGTGKALPNAAAMGNGPGQILSTSGPIGAGTGMASPSNISVEGTLSTDDSGAIANPLAGMGFSDEDYITMIQTLMAAGTITGDMSENVAGVMGIQKGGGSRASVSFSREPSLLGAGLLDAAVASGGSSSQLAGRKRGIAETSPSPPLAMASIKEESNSDYVGGAAPMAKGNSSKVGPAASSSSTSTTTSSKPRTSGGGGASAPSTTNGQESGSGGTGSANANNANSGSSNGNGGNSREKKAKLTQLTA